MRNAYVIKAYAGGYLRVPGPSGTPALVPSLAEATRYVSRLDAIEAGRHGKQYFGLTFRPVALHTQETPQ
jgi:hypothetical protein